MREGCFELYGLWTLLVLCARLTGDFSNHAIKKKLRYNCAIQGARLIWKQKIWLAICERLCSLTNQNACFITFFCIQLPLFCTVLRKNCTVLSQWESSNFFMYIIRSEIIHVISKSNERTARVWFEITSMISDQNCTTRSSITTLLNPFWNRPNTGLGQFKYFIDAELRRFLNKKRNGSDH